MPKILNLSKIKKPLIIGHRGAMGHETENTIASVKKALALNVDMIEIDVFLIKSNELVVFHDENVDHLTNASGKIEAFTLEELQKVKVEGKHRIPTLEEVITTIAKKVPPNIELKGKNTAGSTFQLLNHYCSIGWTKSDFIISSFRWEELKHYRELDSEMALAVLTDKNPLDALAVAKQLSAQAINPCWTTLNPDNVKQIKEAGFEIYTYTVNEPNDLKWAMELGVAGIFCNFPERLRECMMY